MTAPSVVWIKACIVSRFRFSLTNRVDPSPNTMLAPPGCKLDATPRGVSLPLISQFGFKLCACPNVAQSEDTASPSISLFAAGRPAQIAAYWVLASFAEPACSSVRLDRSPKKMVLDSLNNYLQVCPSRQFLFLPIA